MSTASITRAAIHPAIGICRIGDSPDAYFIGPEVPDGHPLPDDGFRDACGRLKRQAARFRVFGYDAEGQVVCELTPDAQVEVEWTVEVANTKASWYAFDLAMDIPQAQAVARRNPSIRGERRRELEIRPSPKTIEGRGNSGSRYVFDDGEFMGKRVTLGELRTDEDGRLLVLGGRGVSSSYDGRPVYTFANNDGWHDDVSDGPVRARVRIGNRDIPVDPAWVVCAPPNYGPSFKSIVTLHDLLTQTMIQAGFVEAPTTVFFTRDVLPILERTARLQWLNYGFLAQFGIEGPQDFSRPEILQRLASEDPRDAELRRQVFNSFRSPDYDDRQRLALPWIYGDGMEVPVSNDRQWLAIPPYMHDQLRKWADGEFVADHGKAPVAPDSLDDVALQDQPETLDEAALDHCLADAFHPGCEVTWPIRHSSMYMAAYRILPRSADDPEPDYGDTLEPKEVYSGGWDTSTAFYGPGTPGGPLWGQRPGDLTRWMATPWQTDTASCRDGYESSYDEYVPTFWPARVPNQVLTESDYETVMDGRRSRDERISAFRTREEWLRVLPGGYFDQIRAMIDDFGALGVVVERPGPADAAELGVPAHIYVEELAEPGRTRATPEAATRARLAKKQLRTVEKGLSLARRRVRGKGRAT